MITQDLALTKVDQTSNPRTFALRSIAGEKSIRGVPTMPAGESYTLTISHGKRDPKDAASPIRHLARFDQTRVNTLTSKVETLSMYVVLENPTSSTFSDAEMEIMKEYLCLCLLNLGGAAGFFDRFQNSEL